VRPIEHVRPASAAAGEVEGLFNRHHEMIFRTAYRVTASIVDAEDVLQTVFLKVIGQKSKRDLSPNPGAYLYRAAINASLDLLRGRARFMSAPIEAADLRSDDGTGSSPEDQQVRRELTAKIRTSVGQLGQRAAEVVILRYFEGHDNKEIAKILGTSQMVVAVTLHRARARLKKEIGQYLEEHYETH
jgi:RNA polymerase sigma-70 factor (ECF subfamily)